LKSLGLNKLIVGFGLLVIPSIWQADSGMYAQNLADSRLLPLNGQIGTPVINCPYSLVRTTIDVRDSSDRGKTTNIRTVYEERDDKGRTRNVSGIGNAQNFQPVTIYITDSVAGTTATLFISSRKAILTQYKPSSPESEPCGRWNKYLSATASGPDGLPPIFVDGVEGFGSRHTINAKSANGQTHAVTTDTWMAEDLHIPLRSEMVNPAEEQILTTVVSNLSRNNPRPEDFQIPPGYQITPQKP
jgi:hypothetical protein